MNKRTAHCPSYVAQLGFKTYNTSLLPPQAYPEAGQGSSLWPRLSGLDPKMWAFLALSPYRITGHA